VLTPVITSDESGEYIVIMDGVPLLQKPEPMFQHALEAWLAAFWVYSIEYPTQLTKTLIFCERTLLGGVLDPYQSKVPTAVTVWSSRLKRSTVVNESPQAPQQE
jgi:hypothetical protein